MINVTSGLFGLPIINEPIKQQNMRSDAFYYDGFGNPCKPEDAWSMSILNYDDSGNFIDSLIAGCNGHSAGDRRVLSMNEEIEIIKPWALKIGIGYEIVELKGEADGIRFYTLSSSILEGKKIGLPVYAIVEDGSPRLLNFREDLYSIAFSL